MVDIDVKDWKIQEENKQEVGINDEENLVLKRIQINSNIKDLDKNFIQRELMGLVKKHKSILNDSIIEVFIRPQYLGIQNQRLIYTRILILTPKERFDVTAEHRNIKLSFYKALFRLENQLSKKKFNIKCSPKKFPYNFNKNSTYKGLNPKTILRKVHSNEVTIGT